MSNFFREFFNKVLRHERPTVIGGYATHSAGELASWLGIGCLILAVVGIIMFILILLIAYQFAHWLNPVTSNLGEQANTAIQGSRAWFDENFQRTQKEVDQLKTQVDDLNKQLDALQQSVQPQL